MDESVTRVRVRNRRGEGARLRDEIVAAAAGLLDETGTVGAITLRSVARRVGIATPSIYRHFPDQAAVVLAVLRDTFAELDEQLRANVAGDAPRARLFALCEGYLTFARTRPGRYGALFGGTWTPDPSTTSVTEEDVAALGRPSILLLAEALDDCVAAGCATSTDVTADAVALWLGLHGLVDQRITAGTPHCPPDITERVIAALAHLADD